MLKHCRLDFKIGITCLEHHYYQHLRDGHKDFLKDPLPSSGLGYSQRNPSVVNRCVLELVALKGYSKISKLEN